jgi:hypothetical protein
MKQQSIGALGIRLADTKTYKNLHQNGHCHEDQYRFSDIISGGEQ